VAIQGAVTIVPTCRHLPISQNLRSPTGNSSVLVRNANSITTVIAMTQTHAEVMGMIVLGNQCIVVRKLNIPRKELTLAPV
jgi:hypothetical protein